MDLINKNNLGEDASKILFEQYKLYVEMADRISQRRMNINTFFISVNTLLLTIVSLVKDSLIGWNMIIGE